MDPAAVREWDMRKAEVRRLEAELEAHLIRYESLDGAADSAHCEALHSEASRLVEQLKRSARQLRITAEDMGGPGLSLRQQAERYEDVVKEKDRALVRIQQTLSRKRDKHILFDTVRRDVDEYTENQNARILQKEQDATRGALNMAQSLRMETEAGRSQLAAQRGMFDKINTGLSQIRERFPGIDKVLGRISQRRHKETIILASVIAVCLFLIWVFW